MSRRNIESEALLSILQDNKESIVLKIERSDLKVGSSLLCDISLPQSGLEEFHFEIINRGSNYTVRPSGRSNLLLNKKPVKEEKSLSDGDLLSAGTLNFLFSLRVQSFGGSTAILQEDILNEDIQKAWILLKTNNGEIPYNLGKNEKVTIGSGKDVDIKIDDRYVSNKHCTIYFDKNTYFIKDNLSKNGTFVNGVRIKESEIKNGSIIRIGKSELIFRTESVHPDLIPESTNEFCGIIGFSPRMKEIFTIIKKVAPTDIPILITGESGTGKELVARAIYKNSSRADKTFIPLNCSSIGRDVIESELFGHIKGSFTGAVANRRGIFEEASDGTVFLDEIGDMPIELQAKILRTIEYGEVRPVGSNKPIIVNTRIISATNKDLEEAARNRQFREDLYYRLGVVHIHMPALRERKEDIIPIAETFLKRFSPSRSITLTSTAKEKLLSYSWPGNVRELKNVVIRSILFAKGDCIDESSVTFHSTGLKDYMRYADRFIKIKPLCEVEKEIIENAMRIYEGDFDKVSERLGISVSELREKVKKYGG